VRLESLPNRSVLRHVARENANSVKRAEVPDEKQSRWMPGGEFLFPDGIGSVAYDLGPVHSLDADTVVLAANKQSISFRTP